MKVLHIIPSVAPVRGGPSQAILQLVHALKSRNLDVEIATTNDNGADLLNVPLQQRINYQQVPVWFFPRFSPKISSFREFAFSSQLTKWLSQNISNYNILHVHAIFSYPSTAAMTIAQRQKVPYIIRCIDQLSEWSLQQGAQKKQIYLNLIESSNLKGSSALHFTSFKEQQEAAKLNLKSPSFILPNGFSPSLNLIDARQRLRQFLGVSNDEKIILFMSRLHPKKGLEYLIPALGKLSHQNFTFVLAGNGTPEYEAEIDLLLLSAGIHKRTYRLGFVAGEMKDLLLQGADMFALTSHSENFGIAVLEAMAAGLPVIITPGVALADFVQQYQLGYITELNIDAIASSIEFFLNYPEISKKMGDRARQLVLEKYTWQQISANLLEIYTAILQQKPIPNFY